MTLEKALEICDAVKPNQYSRSEKIRWLSEADGMVQREIFDCFQPSSFEGYTEETPFCWFPSPIAACTKHICRHKSISIMENLPAIRTARSCIMPSFQLSLHGIGGHTYRNRKTPLRFHESFGISLIESRVPL